MSAEIVQFIPRSRTSRDSDFPTIVFKAPVAPENAHEREIFPKSGYVAPERDPA